MYLYQPSEELIIGSEEVEIYFFWSKKPFPSIQVFFVWYFMLFLTQEENLIRSLFSSVNHLDNQWKLETMHEYLSLPQSLMKNVDDV